MDSVTQFVLGASVAAAALGRRTRPWRAVLWGGVVGTLPDLDVLIDHGDDIANMVQHRAESHALFWLTLATPVLAWGIAALHRERALFWRWSLAVWLALVTHALLDAMTIYGTRLLLPFRDEPFGVGSLFVIDPLYTLPLAVGAAVCCRGGARALVWNRRGLVLSTVYAAWSVVAQQLATAAAHDALRAQGIDAARVVVTPAPLQTLLWRIVAVGEQRAYEGFWSVCDGGRPIVFDAIDRGSEWRQALRSVPRAEVLRDFSGDCTKTERRGDELWLTDLRMGQEPRYVFAFAVARVEDDGAVVAVPAPVRASSRIDVGRGLAWLWPRMWGADIPPPR